MRLRFFALTFVCVVAVAPRAHAQDRGGFTLLATIGYGLQHGDVTNDWDHQNGISESNHRDGLSGLNLGVGYFISHNDALMLRLSRTNTDANYADAFGHGATRDIPAGALTLDLQHWLGDRWNFEVGAGLGFLDVEENDLPGLGLFGAVGYSFLLRGSHSFQIGIENAFYHDEVSDINSLGLCLGFQFM